ncbi:MAG: T9SS type A sorting domain-containing protein [Flavobacteriales bacterium]|nr:T9SS type A sorting domain-containing protein [Flavobacteriales bacterium]MEB2342134.1 T9SS type A sorting domain-containing protein [Flavobacteriia bacterium]
MKTGSILAAVVMVMSTATVAGSGQYTTSGWTEGQYAQQADAPVVIYPNPVIDQVNITFPGLQGDATVSIFAGDGRLMRSIQVGETRDARTVLNLGGMANGVYLVRVVQPSGFDYARRLVVAK